MSFTTKKQRKVSKALRKWKPPMVAQISKPKPKAKPLGAKIAVAASPLVTAPASIFPQFSGTARVESENLSEDKPIFKNPIAGITKQSKVKKIAQFMGIPENEVILLGANGLLLYVKIKKVPLCCVFNKTGDLLQVKTILVKKTKQNRETPKHFAYGLRGDQLKMVSCATKKQAQDAKEQLKKSAHIVGVIPDRVLEKVALASLQKVLKFSRFYVENA